MPNPTSTRTFDTTSKRPHLFDSSIITLPHAHVHHRDGDLLTPTVVVVTRSSSDREFGNSPCTRTRRRDDDLPRSNVHPSKIRHPSRIQPRETGFTSEDDTTYRTQTTHPGTHSSTTQYRRDDTSRPQYNDVRRPTPQSLGIPTFLCPQ